MLYNLQHGQAIKQVPDASGSRQEIGMATYTFYPADNSATVRNVTVVGAPDEFGCIETADGVYVPTPKDTTVVTVEIAPTYGPYTDVFGEYHAE